MENIDILNDSIHMNAAHMIIDQLDNDYHFYGTWPIITQSYMIRIFKKNPNEYSMIRFNELYEEKDPDVYNEFPALCFIKEKSFTESVIIDVIEMGIKYISLSINSKDKSLINEFYQYREVINKSGVYIV